MSRVEKAFFNLRALFCEYKVDAGHGVDHALAVLVHGQNALKYENIDKYEKLAVELACLLHDADDHKFFETKNNENARIILNKVFSRSKEGKFIKDTTLKMIDLVSCSKNKNNIDPSLPKFYYIPRWADRLEALGTIGLERAMIYNQEINRPFCLETTPKPKNLEELYLIATKERFSNYSGVSDSLIDHLYDKVLHLKVETDNKYLDSVFKERHKIIEDFCLKLK